VTSDQRKLLGIVLAYLFGLYLKAYFEDHLASWLAPWLARMAKPIPKHPDSSLEISTRSFEELKARGNEITWAKLGSKFNPRPGASAMGEWEIKS
jgi:hypothetical protein